MSLFFLGISVFRLVPDLLFFICTAMSKEVASIDWGWVLCVWPFITPVAFWGKTRELHPLSGKAIAQRLCVCDGRCGTQYAILPRSKLARYLVCVEPLANSGRGCVLSFISTWITLDSPCRDTKIKRNLFSY